MSVQPPRDLNFFINLHKASRDSGEASSATLTQYEQQLPMENPELQAWINEHRIITKSSNKASVNSKGFDFQQEEDLKKVLKYLPRMPITSEERQTL